MYAYRLESRRVAEPDFPYFGQKLDHPQGVVDFVRGALRDSDIEKMIALYIDNHNTLIGMWVQAGTVNMVPIPLREIAKHALLSGASAVILVHNHPSADTIEPSAADHEVTEQCRWAMELLQIRFCDHIIIGNGQSFLSFRTAGMLK